MHIFEKVGSVSPRSNWAIRALLKGTRNESTLLGLGYELATFRSHTQCTNLFSPMLPMDVLHCVGARQVQVR